MLRTLTANSLAVFLPVLLTQQGMGVGEASAAVSIYLSVSTVGGFLGGPLADAYGARRVIIWTLAGIDTVPADRPAEHGLDVDSPGVDRRISVAVDVASQRDVRPASRAGQRGDRVLPDDGLCLGRGFAAGAGCGNLGDRLGLDVALSITAVVPILAAAVAWPLPRTVTRPPQGRRAGAADRGARCLTCSTLSRMARPPYRDLSYAFGPGPLSPAIKILIIVNVGAFLLSLVVPGVIMALGFPAPAIVEQFADVAVRRPTCSCTEI